jgi:hypothetical protein
MNRYIRISDTQLNATRKKYVLCAFWGYFISLHLLLFTYVLYSNRRFTLNWIPMFVVILSQRITDSCHSTQNMHRRRSCQHPTPPPPKYSSFRHLMIFSHRTEPTVLRHVVWTKGIDVSGAYICIFSDKMPDDGGNSVTHLPDYTASIPDYSIHIHCESTAGFSSRPHQPQEADSRSYGSACAPSTLHTVTTGHTTFPCPLMKLSTDNLVAIKQNKKGESRVRSVYWRRVLEGFWDPKWGCHATPAAVVAIVTQTYNVGW